MKNFYLTLIFCFYTGFVSSQTNSDTLTNEKVISLIKSGLPSSLIITKIQTSITKFDITTDDLIKLKTDGVTDDIINAMINPNSSDANLKASNDSISIYKKWRQVSRIRNGVLEQMTVANTIQFKKDGNYTSISTDRKTNKKFESGGKFELSKDKKRITYFFENAEPYIEEIIKLTGKELETISKIQGFEYHSSFVVDE
jgi:hypothetical protein